MYLSIRRWVKSNPAFGSRKGKERPDEAPQL